MFNWKRKIEYSKYDSSVFKTAVKSDIRNKSRIENGVIDISKFQLAISTAKSILSRSHCYSSEVSAFARSYLLTIPFLISEKDGFLALHNENKDILKDFSKSARIGEIAQGVNYFFAKDYLGAHAIYDFKYYASVKKSITENCKGRTPDYVLCYPDGTISLLESKGTTKANPTDCLFSGREQCKNGKEYLEKHAIAVKNSYVSTVSFGTSSPYMTRHTHVYYTDPEYENGQVNENLNTDLLYEYSKWFYLAGNRNVTEILMRGQTLSYEDYRLLSNNRDGQPIIIYSWNTEFGTDTNPVRVSLGIQPFLLEYLVKGNPDLLKNNLSERTDMTESFADGTFIKIEVLQ